MPVFADALAYDSIMCFKSIILIGRQHCMCALAYA